MVACRVIAFFAWVLPAAAILRHAGSVVDEKKADTDKEVHRVAGLLDVEKDLETDRKKDDVSLHELEAQIVGLVHKRDSAKRDEARKDREIAFLQSQIGRRAHTEASAEVAQESRQESTAQAQADMTVDAAIASADKVVKQAEATEVVSTGRAEEKVDTSAQAAAAAEAAQAARTAAQTAAQAAAQRRAQEEAAASAAAAATARAEAKAAAKRKAQAEESREAFEARIRQEAEEKARIKIAAEQEAENRLRAEAQAKMKVKLEAEQKVKQEAEAVRLKAEQAKVDAANKQREEDQKKKDSLADSADDSFKQFMKEEDGEDQMGDADYEDSANALAGAIGWDRKEIEHKADSAVKQLTEAIGGKRVVQSLQGMMNGVR